MSRQDQEVIDHGKERIKKMYRDLYGSKILEISDTIQKMPDEIRKIIAGIDIYDELIMNQALHKDSAINYFKEVFKLVEEVSGIDLKKEKDLSEKRYKDFIDLLSEGIEVYKKFTNELEKFNKNFSEKKITTIVKKFEIFNKSIENFEKAKIERFNIPFELQKKKAIEKKDPFEIMIPKNFWKEIFKEELFDEEDDY